MANDQLRVYVLEKEVTCTKEVVITDQTNMVLYANQHFVEVPESKLIPFPREHFDESLPIKKVSPNLDTNRAYGLGESVYVANPMGQTNKKVQFFDYDNQIVATSLLDRLEYEKLKKRVLNTRDDRQTKLQEAQLAYSQAVEEAQRIREEAIKQVPEGISLESLLGISDS